MGLKHIIDWFRVDTFEGLHNLVDKVFSEK
jgi:hypothetical protein